MEMSHEVKTSRTRRLCCHIGHKMSSLVLVIFQPWHATSHVFTTASDSGTNKTLMFCDWAVEKKF